MEIRGIDFIGKYRHDVDTVEINDTLGVFDGIDQLNTSFTYAGEELGYLSK